MAFTLGKQSDDAAGDADHDAPAPPRAAAPAASPAPSDQAADEYAGFSRSDAPRPATPPKATAAAPAEPEGLEAKLAGLTDIPETSAPAAPARPPARPGRMGLSAAIPGLPTQEPAASASGFPADDAPHAAAPPPDWSAPADGAPAADVPDAEAPAPVDERNFVYTGADNLSEMVSKLLRSSNLPEDQAQRMSAEWCDTLAKNRFDRITNVDPKKKLLDDAIAQRQAREGAASTANGGALGSILGAMLGSQSKGDKNLRRRQREYDAAKDAQERQQAEAAAGMRNRIFDTRQKQAGQANLELGEDIDALSRSVRMYNDAFIDAPAAAALKASVQAEAARNDGSVAEILESIGRGDASPKLMAEYDSIQAAVQQDENVRTARAHMRKREAEVQDGFRKGMQNIDLMARNFPDRFDGDVAQRELTETLDMLPGNVPTSVSETTDAEAGLKANMAKLAEEIRKGFEKLFENLMSAFSPK